MLTWKYVIVLNMGGKHKFKQFYYNYTCYRNTYPKGRELIKMYRVGR